MLIHLGLSALAAFGFALVLLLRGESSLPALTHLLLAFGIMPLIFGAIAHFVPVLTRSREPHRALLLAPLLLQLGGFLVFLHFSGVAGVDVLLAAASICLAITAVFAAWLCLRAHRALGSPHPGWRWYLVAIGLLAAGLATVPLMYFRPEWRVPLRLIHLHLNTLGFVGLAAIGTLQVLLPTVLSGPDREAADRLRRDLPLAAVAVVGVGIGAALAWPLSLAGGALLVYVAGRTGLAWMRQYGLRAIVADGASAALAAALAGFLLLLIAGFGHGVGRLNANDALPGFMVVFLLPLVTGALSQLLPVWRYPGRRTPVRDRMRSELVRGGALRSAFFIGGGVLVVWGESWGIWPAVAGLVSFVLGVIRAFWPQPRQVRNTDS